MKWLELILTVIEVILLGYITWVEHRALEVSRLTLKFYSEFISSRTKWYSARTKIKSAQAEGPEPAITEPSLAIAVSSETAETDELQSPEPASPSGISSEPQQGS